VARRRKGLGSVVNDSAYIASRLPWWAAFIFGTLSFLFLYFAVPAWLSGNQEGRDAGFLRPVIEVIYTKHINKFQWAGIACGILGLYFTIRNYLIFKVADGTERGLLSTLAKIFGRYFD
jgi:hypothetical protein